jgi:dTDP-4-dehydrorhamnose reductase
MHILVTGGRGQLGCSIKKISYDYAHKFFFTDLPEMDITNYDSVNNFVIEKKIDVVINCASYTAVEKAEKEVELAEKINRLGTEIIAQVVFVNKIKLVHLSTDYVFKGEHPFPLKETDQPSPLNVYGKTKFNSEIVVQKSGCDAVIIRTSWLYSEFGNNFLKTMLRLGKERESLTVVYDQVGSPTYATDLAIAIMKVIEKGIQGCEIYHFSNEGVVSWYDFAKEIFDQTNNQISVIPIDSQHFSTNVKRPAYSVMAKDKIKKIGVIVPYWKDSLKKCLNIIESI